MTTVTIYSKTGCGKCEAAKKKMQSMNIPYTERNAMIYVEPHDGWREDGSVDVMAVYQVTNTLPVFRINDDFMDYPNAMKQLKQVSDQFKLPPMTPLKKESPEQNLAVA